MDTSRNIVLLLLVVAIGIAVFYMMDPTLGGMLGVRSNDSFAVQRKAMDSVVTQQKAAASVSGKTPEMFENGDMIAKAIANAKAIEEAKMALQASSGSQNPVTQGFTDYNKRKNNVEGFANYEKEKKMEGFTDVENAEASPFPEAAQPTNCYPKNQLSPQELLPADPNSKWAQVNPMGQGNISGKNFLNAGSLIGVNTVGQSLRNANQQLRSEPANPQIQVSIWNQSTIEPDLQRRPLDGF